MRHVIFIRTYRGDREWLRLCLNSLQKYANGYERIFVAYPLDDLMVFEPILREFAQCRVPITPEPVVRFQDDYIGQQYSKMEADTKTGLNCCITFWDSDTIATGPFNPQMLMNGDKPIILMTPYAIFKSTDGALAWQKITEKWMGEPVSYEFMRRMPLMYKAEHLSQIRNWYGVKNRNCTLRGDLFKMALNGRREFSEFNFIGAWVHANYPNEYEWVDTSAGLEWKRFPAKQFWSWGGITADILKEINRFMNEPEIVEQPALDNPVPSVEETSETPQEEPVDMNDSEQKFMETTEEGL